MNPGWSPAHERAVTLAFDKQTVSAPFDIWQNATAGTPTERKRSDKSDPTSLLLRLLYWIYERRLLDQIKQRPMPRHVGVILDGNRRHARKRGVSDPCEIYQRGAEKLDDILNWCAELRIPALTLWVFSTENLKRSEAEVSGILSAIEAKVSALAHEPFMHQKRVRIQAIGRLDLLPESVVAAIRAAETATAQYDLITLTIAVGYGGREEIADAVRSFVKVQALQGASLSDVIERITPEAIACHLYAADLPDPDLIIRTSGEIRLSGFLLWQSVHSEFYFTDALWPAFRKVDFLRAIRAYQARNRRFGCRHCASPTIERLAFGRAFAEEPGAPGGEGEPCTGTGGDSPFERRVDMPPVRWQRRSSHDGESWPGVLAVRQSRRSRVPVCRR